MQGWVGVRAGSGQQSSSKGYGLAKASGQGGGLKVVLSTDPVRFPLTGIGRYTYELARGLHNAKLYVLLFLQGAVLHKSLLQVGDWQAHSRGSRLRRWLQRQDWALRLNALIRTHRQQGAMVGLNDHVLHGPDLYLPRHHGPSVVTLHDLSVYKWSPFTH